MECFKVYINEIEGRIDPFYLKNISIIRNPKTNFNLVPLGNLLKDKIQYGANERAIDGNRDKDIRYIRITDIDEFGNLKNDDWKTAEKIEDKYLLQENDILFARSGATAGKTFIFKKEFGKSIFAGYLIRLKIDGNKANPKFIFFYTQLKRYTAWVKSIQRPSGQPNINSEEFQSFEIPLPPFEIQNKIVQLMDNAYSLKKTKESEAQQLLDSIDDYVLDELGIKLPELKDEMSYVVDSSSIRGRVDPYYYQPKFEEVEKSIYQGKFDVKELKDSFKNDLIKGMLPSEEEKDGDIKVLQIKNILKNGLINTSEYVTAKNIFKSEHKIKKEEIIIVITGATIGKVGLWYSDEEFYLGGDMIKFSVNNRFNPYFIQAFLLSQAGQYQLMREITGATNKHLSPDNVKAIKVSLPPLEIQNKIAEEVKARMQKAKQLQEEAKSILEEAKERVERIILGNEEI
jgi:restriction endonuclease S subunit